MDYDEVTQSDLENLKNWMTSQLEFFSEKILELNAKNKTLKTYDARVIGYPTDNDEFIHGPGAVQIDCPELFIGKDSKYFASQRNRSQEGTFELPSLDSWVSIYRDPSDERFYILGYTFPIRAEYKSGEQIGYIGSSTVSKPIKAGARFDRVRKNPGVYRLLQSSNNFIFSEDRDAKEITLEATTDWKISVLTENNGKIDIGSSGVGDSVDVNISTYNTGSINLKTDTVTMKIDRTSAQVEVLNTKFKLTGAEAIIESTSIKSKGDWKHDGKLSVTETLTVDKDIRGKAEVYAMHGTPEQVSQTKHLHKFATPGPPDPPTPGI